MKVKKQYIWLFGIILLAGILSFFLLSSANVKVFFIGEKASYQHDRGHYDRAIQSYEKLIELDPKTGSNYWNLAVAYLQKGDKVHATKQIVRLRSIGEDDLAVMLKDFIKRNE